MGVRQRREPDHRHKTGTPIVYSAFNGADQLCWSSTTSGIDCASAPAGATTYAYDATGNQPGDQLADGPALANTFNVFNQLTDSLIDRATLGEVVSIPSA